MSIRWQPAGKIVVHLLERILAREFIGLQAQTQPEPIDQRGDSEGYVLAFVLGHECDQSRHQIRSHSCVNDFLNACQLRLSRNLRTQR